MTRKRRSVNWPVGVTARGCESSHSVAEQNRSEVDDDLVEQPALEALLGKVGAEDADVLASGCLHCPPDRSLDVLVDERPRGSESSDRLRESAEGSYD